jgi:hypothetical protein
MPSKKAASGAQVDPALTRQLEQRAGSSGEDTLGAVLSLRAPKSRKFLSARETESIVRQVLQRVKTEVGSGPQDLNVFANLGSFVVTATPQFIRTLIDQQEIATATANEQPQDLAIEPVGSEPVDLDSVGKEPPRARGKEPAAKR